MTKNSWTILLKKKKLFVKVQGFRLSNACSAPSCQSVDSTIARERYSGGLCMWIYVFLPVLFVVLTGLGCRDE